MKIVVIPINSEASEVDKAFEAGAGVVIHETNRYSGKASVGHYCDVTTRSGDLAGRIRQDFPDWSSLVNAAEGYSIFRVMGDKTEKTIAARVKNCVETVIFPP